MPVTARPDPVASKASEPRRRSRLRAGIDLIRPPHWVKNIFVLAPLLFSKMFDDATAVLHSVTAFVVFCLASSLVYVVNDWCDRLDDATHPLKRDRPFAAGELQRSAGVAIGATLIALGVAIGLLIELPILFWGVVAGYVVLNVAYSAWLRSVALVDISVVAFGFVLRVLAGSAVLSVEPSEWIVLATGLLALLLALGKRRVDLAYETPTSRPSLSGYTVEFVDASLSALAAAVIGFYALFTVSDYAIERYGSPYLYVTTFWVVLGIVRYLQVVIALGNRGSPTEIALGDRSMQVIGIGWLITFVLVAFVF
jgi:decaprenyl-phosphate phosphoribosyltransferase